MKRNRLLLNNSGLVAKKVNQIVGKPKEKRACANLRVLPTVKLAYSVTMSRTRASNELYE